MKEYKSMAAYCRETGFPIRLMRKAVHSRESDEFCHRNSGARNAAINIDVQVFEKKLAAGDFKEVFES